MHEAELRARVRVVETAGKRLPQLAAAKGNHGGEG